MIRDRLKHLQRRVRQRVDEAVEASRTLATTRSAGPMAPSEEDPPVVARLMVEIRSDGSRTIARGAVEDMATGERVGLEAKGSTPAQLAGSLAKSLFSVPLLARSLVRSAIQASESGERPSPKPSSGPEGEPAGGETHVTTSGQSADDEPDA